MSRARLWTALAMGALVGLCLSGMAMAQATPPTPPTPPAPPPGGNAQRGGQRLTAEEMQQRMAEYRKRAADQQRQELGASEDEWKVLQPLIEKVQTLQRAARGGTSGGFGGFGGFGGTGGFGNFGGRGRGDRGSRDANSTTPAATTPQVRTNPDGTPHELTDIEKATTALNDVLKNKDASPTQIAEALTALRAARAKSQQELDQAREVLKKVLTAKQEAMLVLRGILN